MIRLGKVRKKIYIQKEIRRDGHRKIYRNTEKARERYESCSRFKNFVFLNCILKEGREKEERERERKREKKRERERQREKERERKKKRQREKRENFIFKLTLIATL